MICTKCKKDVDFIPGTKNTWCRSCLAKYSRDKRRKERELVKAPVGFVKHPFSKYLWANKKGQIWNKRYKRIVGIKNISGYIKVYAVDRIRPAHQIILETFIGLCPKGMETCHNNGIKMDNRLKNLRWDTRKSNGIDRRNHNTIL